MSWKRLFNKDHADRQLDEELRSYIETDIESRIAAGIPPEEARRQALIAFGGVDQVKEQVRDSRTEAWIGGILIDLRYALRSFSKRPAFTFLAVLTMALGIGAATATFSVLDTVVLRPLPYRNADRLVAVRATVPTWRDNPATAKIWDQMTLSYNQFLELKKHPKLFDEISAFLTDSVVLTGRRQAQSLKAGVAPADLFPMLGVQAVRGRLFVSQDEAADQNLTVVLSHALWTREFGASPDVLGQTIVLNRTEGPGTYSIVGVLPANFQFHTEGMDREKPPDLWIPLRPAMKGFDKTDPDYETIALLPQNASIAAIEQEAAGAIAGVVAPEWKNIFGNEGVHLVSRHDEEIGDTRRPLLIVFAASGLLLLIACGNVANLLLGQMTARSHEIAIRMALGAGRSRIIRQLLTESILLSSAGGAAGSLVAWWAMRGLVFVAPENFPHVHDIGLDFRVLAFMTVASILTGLVFGLAPAFAAAGQDLNKTIKESGRPHASRIGKLQGLLVVAEISLSFVLLVAAGLLAQSLFRLSTVNPGFRIENLLNVNLDIQSNNPDKIRALYENVSSRLKLLPGVEGLTGTGCAPFQCRNLVLVDEVEGQPKQTDTMIFSIEGHSVYPNYFAVTGTPMLSGREFTDAEGRKDAPVAIINKTMAKRFWPGQNPIGSKIKSGDRWIPVIGVVNDMKETGLGVDTISTFYMPSYFGGRTTFLIRTSGDATTLGALIRQEISAIDKDLPAAKVETMNEIITRSTENERYRTTLITIFALMAVCLALIGLYGVVSRTVTSRNRELGIRLALGARPNDILLLVLRKGLAWAAIGIALGLAAAALSTRILSSFLFDIGATDARTYIALAMGVLVVAMLASYIPARRASRIDPLRCLRTE